MKEHHGLLAGPEQPHLWEEERAREWGLPPAEGARAQSKETLRSGLCAVIPSTGWRLNFASQMGPG